jgi:transcriptional regulator with XRE-family HTH domain
MDAPNYILIGKRIKERRLDLGLTQEKLAEAAGVGIQHTSKIENGHTKLSLPAIISIANVLETTVDNLLMDSIDASQPAVVHEMESSIFADCTPAELSVLRATASALKRALREQNSVRIEK